jgi:hypothetical protein
MLMLEVRLRSLLASLAVHVEAWVLEEPTALLDAGEWGVAFEALCDNIYDGELAVFPGEVAEIESLGASLGSTRRAWRLIRELMVES